MTFPLTNAGRDNIEAILAEFERAGHFYPPLYHERLIACSESGEVHLSETDWQAFIDAQSNDLDDGDWSQWDGPYSASPDYYATCLGRWSGAHDGLQEFINLANSVTEVLKREDFSGVDDRYLRFSFGSWREWLSTIHSWAFQFQMPLLCSDMTLWGAEDFNQDDFYELAEQMSQTGDVAWPLHPVKWSLTYNVFTSSAAAIRAILRPQTVIGLNEPWPNDKATAIHIPEENGDIATASCHRLVRTEMGWILQLAESHRPIWTECQSGLHRIAELIDKCGQSFTEEDLYKYGARNFRQGRPIHKKKLLDAEDGITERKNQKMWQRTIDEAGCRKVGENLQELINDRDQANDAQNFPLVDEIEKQIAAIKKAYYVNKDGIVVPRLFRDAQQKKNYDAICATIDDSIQSLKKQLPAQCTAMKELEDQLVYANLKFEPNEKYTPWRVVR